MKRQRERKAEHFWCGTEYRNGRRGCPRGVACHAEEREWQRVTALADSSGAASDDSRGRRKRRDTQDH